MFICTHHGFILNILSMYFYFFVLVYSQIPSYFSIFCAVDVIHVLFTRIGWSFFELLPKSFNWIMCLYVFVTHIISSFVIWIITGLVDVYKFLSDLNVFSPGCHIYFCIYLHLCRSYVCLCFVIVLCSHWIADMVESCLCPFSPVVRFVPTDGLCRTAWANSQEGASQHLEAVEGQCMCGRSYEHECCCCMGWWAGRNSDNLSSYVSFHVAEVIPTLHVLVG